MIINELAAELKLSAEKISKYRQQKEPPTKWEDGKKGNVLLIPGIGEGWTFLGPIGDRLNTKGYKIHYPIYRKQTRDKIEEISELVIKYVLVNKLENIIVIGHSKGGLVAQRLLNSPIKNKIGKTIIIACPNKGSIWCYLPVKGLEQMKPRQEMIVKISSKLNRKLILNLLPKWDNMVIPQSSLLIEGCRNIEIPVIGHNRILEDPLTWQLIEKEIDSRMSYESNKKSKNRN